MITAAGEYPAAVNVGVQPTIPSGKVTVEAHVLDGEPELYGQNVILIPGDRIRPEKKFESTEALTEQIRKDQETVRNWYAKTATDAG
jgi:riboflavin kinase/FMN adenylyltransferase